MSRGLRFGLPEMEEPEAIRHLKQQRQEEEARLAQERALAAQRLQRQEERVRQERQWERDFVRRLSSNTSLDLQAAEGESPPRHSVPLPCGPASPGTLTGSVTNTTTTTIEASSASVRWSLRTEEAALATQAKSTAGVTALLMPGGEGPGHRFRDMLGFEVGASDQRVYSLVYAQRLETEGHSVWGESRLARCWNELQRTWVTASGAVIPSRTADAFRELLDQGIPCEIRWRIWWALSNASSIKEIADFTYVEYYSQFTEYEDLNFVEYSRTRELTPLENMLQVISNDLPRTFAEHPLLHTDAGELALCRLLHAFVARNPQIGYSQGLSYLAAFLLLNAHLHETLMNELQGHSPPMDFSANTQETVFWVFCALIEKQFPTHYNDTLEGTRVDLLVLDEVSATHPGFEDLHAHFERHHFQLPFIAMNWLIPLFTTQLPAETCCRLFDYLFSDGSRVIIRAGVGLMMECKEELLAVDTIPKFAAILENRSRKFFDEDKFCQMLRSVDLDSETLADIRKRCLRKISQEKLLRSQKENVMRLQKQTAFSRFELERLQEEFLSFVRKDEIESADSMNEVGISQDRFAEVMGNVMPRWKNATDKLPLLFRVFDKNGDGILQFQELICGLTLLLRGSFREKLQTVFDAFDLDRNRSIDRDEMQNMLSTVFQLFEREDAEASAAEIVDSSFSHLDLNGDGVIDFQEFERAALIHPWIVDAFILTENPSLVPVSGAGGSSSGGAPMPPPVVLHPLMENPLPVRNSAPHHVSPLTGDSDRSPFNQNSHHIDSPSLRPNGIEPLASAGGVAPTTRFPGADTRTQKAPDPATFEDVALPSDGPGVLNARWKPKPRDTWEPDNSRPDCSICHVSFTFFRRRHHCRNCGRLVCSRCSQWRFKDERICDDCQGKGVSSSFRGRKPFSR